MPSYTYVKHEEDMDMGTVALRRSGGSLILAVPAAFAAQNHLVAGCQLVWKIEGDALVVKPSRKKPTLAELIAATPKEARVEGWDEMAAVGNEQW
jgi:antitoxin component of MazEF toxin-antitoxin module